MATMQPPNPARAWRAPTTFVVYSAARQWRKVEAALKDPDDSLIVEGMPAYDAQLPGLALLAQRVMTKGLQAAKRPVTACGP